MNLNTPFKHELKLWHGDECLTSLLCFADKLTVTTSGVFRGGGGATAPPFGVVYAGGGPGPPPLALIRGAVGGVWLGFLRRCTE
jgi:hypothetical protein